MRPIHLYTPYYLAGSAERQVELDRCLAQNLANPALTRIVLLCDDAHRPQVTDPRLEIVAIPGRPTYADWIDLTAREGGGAISVLANSDIFLDKSVPALVRILESRPEAFVALSRWEEESPGAAPTLHPRPHWSQDTWALSGARPVDPALRARLAIPLGVPRCDNKVAYLFSVHGWEVLNPCWFVRSIHVHATGERGYDPHQDRRILGGVAYVHPMTDKAGTSELAYDVWSVGPQKVTQIKANYTILKKARSGLGAPPKPPANPLVAAFDSGWQYPAITEQHAFHRVRARLRLRRDPGTVRYLAFPWATLIDTAMHNRKDPSKAAFLRTKLAALRTATEGAERVITVCQHIHALKFQETFAEAGVTDLFWSHARKGQAALPEAPGVAVHPFPLYAVQAADCVTPLRAQKKHLFSFVGAKANKYYMTDCRNIILDTLAAEPDGLVLGKDSWHYNRIVYDLQVRELTDTGTGLVDEEASRRFREILSQSVFALCPSGSGPNSIRLWEAIGLGAIPVILSDRIALPGDPRLWEEGAVVCGETEAEIRALPGRLRALHADRDGLEAMRRALAQIWMLYGPDRFTADVEALALAHLGRPGLDGGTAGLRSLGALTSRLLTAGETVTEAALEAEAPAIRRAFDAADAETRALLMEAAALAGRDGTLRRLGCDFT